MRVLVTGGGGFVGGRIVDRLLERGWSVRSFGRAAQPALEARGVEVVRGDLADAASVGAACAGMDAVFHTAAKAGVWGRWEDYYRPNVAGARNVARACREKGVPYLVHTSTPSVVFNRRAIRGADERMPYGRRWLCHYAHTKALAERAVFALRSDALRVVALRPHLVFGPGDPHLLPRVLESAVAGRLKQVGGGDSRVDVAYIDNVADAHLRALDALPAGRGDGRAYFISQGEPVRLWDWINGILERLGHRPVKGRVPLPVAYALGGLCELVWALGRRTDDPPMTRFVAVELGKDHFFNTDAARRELGFAPNVGMAAALDRTVEDLRQRGFGAD